MSRDKHIIRQNVLARAVELYIAGLIEREQIFAKAEEFEEWIYEAKEQGRTNRKEYY